MGGHEADFSDLMRASGDRAGCHALLLALGFGPVGLDPIELAVEPAARVQQVGARPGALGWLIQLPAETRFTRVRVLARALTALDAGRQHLLLVADAGYGRLSLAWLDPAGELRQVSWEPARVRPTDVETVAELAAPSGDGSVALVARYARALDRTRVGRRFFEDFRRQRDLVAAGWTGVPRQARADREQLALLFLCRLMFLYFLQRRGHLAGDPEYLPSLIRRAHTSRSEPASRANPTSVYRSLIRALFFGALNRRPGHRSARARALGGLPYLNGGLFERHALERRYPKLDLPDEGVVGVFDQLLERYRFTTRDGADSVSEGANDAAVDPEMLGRVFEGVMAADRRGDTGTFYTPARVVDRMVRSALTAWVMRFCRLPREDALRIAEQDDLGALDTEQRSRLRRALADIRVLDPACGSGAFLLGLLARLSRLRAALGPASSAELRQRIVGSSLHGVDIEPDAALLCALRLWLALIDEHAEPGEVQPLPNLDRRVRQGDALLDPLDVAAAHGSGLDARAARDPAVRRAAAALRPAARAYLTAGPHRRRPLEARLRRLERALADAWAGALDRRLRYRAAELAALAGANDLWGQPTLQAARAARDRRTLERRRHALNDVACALNDTGAVPFFSFRVHFADAESRGFDIIVSNPPWVRAHRWPAAIGRLVRERFSVCRDPGWRADIGAGHAPAAGQVDLAMLFLERSIGLLTSSGVLALMLPAKMFRAMYGGAARRLVLQSTEPLEIEDHALDQRAIFKADAFAGLLVARKLAVDVGTAGHAEADILGPSASCGRSGIADPSPRATDPVQRVRITMVRRSVEPLRFDAAPSDLPLEPGDLASPWLLVPPDVNDALRRMQRAGAPLAKGHGLRVRRGLLTGANDILLVREARAKLGGLAHIRAEGWFRGREGRARSAYESVVEASALRPIVRGAGIDAWSYEIGGHAVWVHDESGKACPPPPRMASYLSGHAERLQDRSGTRDGAPAGALLRVNPDLLRSKVAWHDLADDLHAVALPDRCRSLGASRSLLPLNTVYYVASYDTAQANLLAAYLNSLPVRTFARAIAERAKDARFRFFAWTVASVPLPDLWRAGPTAQWLIRFARSAHEAAGVSAHEQAELDARVAAVYGLRPTQFEALMRFDAWLRGAS